MASEWSDELKQEIVEEYKRRNPTPENTTDIVIELAEDYDKTPNGLRRILVAEGVYVSKAQTNSKKDEGAEKPKRASKADSIADLVELLNFAGLPVDKDILDKLTGKAAVYFTDVVKRAMEVKNG